MTRKLTPLLAALVLGVAACGGDDNDEPTTGADTPAATTEQTAEKIERDEANAGTTLTVGSKNFTEQKVLGEVYAQAFEAAGFTVERSLDLGDEQTARKALQDGQISGYPEYTGTALLSFLEVPAEDLPSDEGDAYEQVRDGLAEDGIAALEPTPFTSSNEVGVTREKAEELGLTKISDLEGKAQDLTLYGSPECRTRQDCLLGLQEVYGLEFRSFRPVNIDQRHEVLTSGQADLSIVFTTDPQIKRNDIVLLEDDKGMFPPYNSTFLVEQETLEKSPGIEEVVTKVNEQLTDEVMQELNARVDLDRETPEEAAKAYLEQYGLV